MTWIQKRIYALITTFYPSATDDLSNVYVAVDQNGWGKARKMPLLAIFNFAAIQNASRMGRTTVNTGTTTISYSTPFNASVVSDATIGNPYVRRTSDNAVVDFVISNETLTGFDITVWEDNITLRYKAIPDFII